MPLRTVKQHYSDRGSIKDLVTNAKEPPLSEEKPSASELRMKKLYEYAQMHKDQEMQLALGFITTDYIGDKSALPLSAYRLRKIVDDIKAKSPGKFEALEGKLDVLFAPPPSLSQEALDYLAKFKSRVKTASPKKPPVFRRVS